MDNKFVGLMVGLTVGVLMVSGFLWPIVSDATATDKTFENTGLYYMTNPTESVHLEYLGNANWEVNDEPLTYTNIGATNIIVTDSLFVRNIGQVRGSLNVTWTTADLTIGNGSITGTATTTGGTVTVDITYTEVYVATNEKAEYVMKSNTSPSYITAESKLIGKGLSSVKDSTGNNNTSEFSIIVDDLTATVTTSNQNISISNVAVNYTEVEGYVGLLKFESVTFTVTWGEYSTDCTYNIVIVPSEVTVEKADHLDTMQIAMVGVIGTLGAIVLIAAAAGAIRRLD